MQYSARTISEISKRVNLSGLLSVLGDQPGGEPSADFDYSQAGEAECAPHAPPPLFASHQRLIGNPAEVFRHLAAAPKDHSRTQATAEWIDMVDNLGPFGVKGQIAGINTYLNNSEHAAELAYYAKVKRWAAPLAYFGSDAHAGDVAIAKYVSLRRLGFHPDRLRLVWLWDTVDDSDHTVLAVFLDGRAFVLDDRYGDIATDEAYPEARPICSLNGWRFFLHWDPSDPDGAATAVDEFVRRLGVARA